MTSRVNRFGRSSTGVLAVALLGTTVVAGTAATTHADSGIVAAALGAPPQTSASPVKRYRPLHKGGADLSTGLYVREDDDLWLDTSIPVVVRRTHRSDDPYPRPFGIGATHPGEWWLSGDSDPRIPWANLILPNGTVHFTRISPGNTQADAVLLHDTTATEFNGALLSWNGTLWQIKFRDGSVAFFTDCEGAETHCRLVERRDAQGHRAMYVRDAAQRLLRIESEGQWIAFDYDGKRITRAADSGGHRVAYAYDERGRLVTATYSDGVVRTYTYDAGGHMTSVHEPGRIVLNWFDDAGRFIRQEVRDSADDPDPYIATVQYVVEKGRIVQTDFDEGDGLERTRYNSTGHTISKTFGADSASPVTFTFARDTTTNAVTAAMLSCGGDEARPVPAAMANDPDLQSLLMYRLCGRR